MSGPFQDFWEEDDAAPQRIRRKKDRPQGRRRLSELTAEASDIDADDATDDLISRLQSLGHLHEVLSELKSGKEATAYVASGPHGEMLLKVYRDLSARSFKDDRIYREGQVTLDARAKRAMDSRSRKGLAMLQESWVMAEYAHLWRLWQAGLPVPRPLVGPAPYDYAQTVPAVLMELIGTPDAPAPRLSDARLTPAEAASAWEQAVSGMAALLRLGYAHGDYSTYNLLWWENTVTIIDFPQLTTRQNPNFGALLARDAQSLATSFRKHGLQESGDATLREVQRRALSSAPTPRVMLP